MTNAAVEELLAKQAIREVIYRYCRGLDRMDRALALSCWHPGGTADRLRELKHLLDDNLITEQEFEERRSKLVREL